MLSPYHEVLVHTLLSRVPFIEPSSEVMTASTLGLVARGVLFQLRRRVGPGDAKTIRSVVQPPSSWQRGLLHRGWPCPPPCRLDELAQGLDQHRGEGKTLVLADGGGPLGRHRQVVAEDRDIVRRQPRTRLNRPDYRLI